MLGEKIINGYDSALHFAPWTLTAGDPSSFPPHDNATAVDDYSNFLDWEANDVGNRNVITIDALLRSSDHFRMFEFKVRMCASAKPHDWTECPYAHLGEKARRRDPRKFGYSGAACPDFRKGSCRRGYACEFAHGVFESWLHPARYRTQLCKDGPNCTRRVCFFAHSLDQLRVLNLNTTADGFPYAVVESPASLTSPRMPGNSATEIVAYLEELQLNKVKSMSSPTITGREYFRSLPVPMERVESGMGLRALMFEKLSRENPLTWTGTGSNLEFGVGYH